MRIHGNGTVGICDHPEKTKLFNSGIFVCDTFEICENCEFYKCKNTEESVEQEFGDLLKDPSRCGQEYPKTAMLLWVLSGDYFRKPWYRAIWDKIRGIYD